MFARKPSRTTTRTPRPDYTRIALLEWELFGIEPTLGTAAAAIAGLQRLSSALNTERPLSEQWANPGLLGTERR